MIKKMIFTSLLTATISFSVFADGDYSLGINFKADEGSSPKCINVSTTLQATCSSGFFQETTAGVKLGGITDGSQMYFPGGSIFNIYQVNYITLTIQS